jgi:D-3-phosphoglycerate dehydrogenase
MLGACDVVCLHARLTDETRRFIGAAEFAAMPRHAVFVNNARSGMVDMDALADALASGDIAAAGIDVFDEEPLPGDSPWRRMDDATVTPHLAGQSTMMRRLTAELAADAVRDLIVEGAARNTVNAARL